MQHAPAIIIPSKLPRLRLMMAVCSNGMWYEDFGMSYAKLAAFLSSRPIKGYSPERSLFLYNKKGSSSMQVAREEIFHIATQERITHAFLCDSDQSFPQDIVHQLIAHEKPVVVCNVATKNLPAAPTARVANGTPWGKPLSSKGKRGLEKVWRIGFAVALIDMRVINEIPKPHFAAAWNPEKQDYDTEDWFFCSVLERAGVDIWVDHDASRKIGHTGMLTYTQDMIPDDIDEHLPISIGKQEREHAQVAQAIR